MTKDNWKQVLISILIGAGVAFFSSLFQGLADILKNNATEIASGSVSGLVYFIRSLRHA